MANPLLEKLDLDDVLVKFKIYARYHAVTGVFLHLAMIYEFLTYYNYVFVAEQVGYRCVAFISELQEVNNSTQNTTIEWCRNPSSCSEWVYDNPDSFVAEFQLACHDWKRTLLGSAHNFGYMAGLLLIGPLSDRFGRKPLAILTGVSAGLLGSAKSVVTSYWLYVALEFLEAAIGDGFSPLFMLSIEMVDTKSRLTYTAMCQAGLGIGGIVVPLLAWRIPYWRTLLKVMYAPGLLSIFFIYLLDESPRWLLAKGKKTTAVKILKNAAKINKIEIEENLNTISYEKENKSGLFAAIRDTLNSKLLLKRYLVCLTWWAVCIFVNYALVVNSTLLQGNKYINFGLTNLMKTISNLIAAYIINRFNRRSPLIFCFLACGALCIGQSFIPTNLHWLQISNYMVGMLMSSLCFNTIYIYTSELFPTQSRNSMHALCSSTGRIGSIMAPQIPLLMVYWSGLPTVLFGAMSLFAGLVTLLVPDTAEINLPDTVVQAEKMENGNREIGTITESRGAEGLSGV